MKIITLVLFLLFSQFILASNKSQHSFYADSTNISQTPQRDYQLESYKLLYDTAEKAYENQRATTQWFIGTIMAFLLVVLGSQVFFNIRYNRQVISNVENKFDKKLAEQLTEVISREADMLKQIIDERDKSIGETETRINEQIAALDNSNKRLFKLEIKNINKEISHIQINLLRSRADIYYNSEKYDFALWHYISSAEKSLDSNIRPTSSITGILRSLKLIDKLDETNIEEVEALMKQYQERYSEDMSRSANDVMKFITAYRSDSNKD